MIKTKSTPIVIRIKQPPTPKQKAPKLTYFKVDLAITFARCAFMCKDDSQEAVYELFDGFGIPLPDSWDIGFDADRPFAETITAFVTIYAAIPKTEADHLTNAQVGNQVKAAVAYYLLTAIESNSPVSDEARGLSKASATCASAGSNDPRSRKMTGMAALDSTRPTI